MELDLSSELQPKGFTAIVSKLLTVALTLASLYSIYVVIHPHTPLAKLQISILDITQLQRATHVFLLLFCGFLVSSLYTSVTPPSIGTFTFLIFALVPIHALFKLKTALFVKLLCSLVWIIIVVPLFLPKVRRLSDVAVALIMIIPYIYEVIMFQDIIVRAMFPEPMDIVMSFSMFMGLLGLVYRLTGPVLPCLVLFFLFYNLHGEAFPRVLSHAPFDLELLLGKIYSETEAGLFGLITGVSSKYLVYFTILGGIVGALKIGRLIANIASVVVGKGRDAAGKVTIVASIFMGMFSGSGAADTQFVSTIAKPLYEKSGYDRFIAAGIAATAGTIAMITPPVLGSMAFIMVEVLSIPYSWVCIMAIAPMMIYLVAIWSYNRFYSMRYNLRPVETSETLNYKYFLSYAHIFVPILLIIAVIFLGYPVNMGVVIATVTFIVIAYIDKRIERPSAKVIINGLAVGFRALLPIGTAVVAANIIMTLMVITGLPSKFSLLLGHLAGENLFIATSFAAVFSLILGMGVPPTATYVIASSLTAPAICQIAIANGIPSEAALLATHMFLMYYAILADVTPPVGLSAYASASVFGTHPLRTGIYAARVAIPKYLVGFSFILSFSGTALLIVPVWNLLPWWHSTALIGARLLCAFIGAALLSGAGAGYLIKPLSIHHRWVIGIISLGFFWPDWIINVISFVITLIVFLVSGQFSKKGVIQERAKA
ncbi:MAG: TRAP transporter fused permease subunit [Syntrophobacterales bacterium]|nr:TRAP transporter fused permease subunit [Syntrophobacterales bacterium]